MVSVLHCKFRAASKPTDILRWRRETTIQNQPYSQRSLLQNLSPLVYISVRPHPLCHHRHAWGRDDLLRPQCRFYAIGHGQRQARLWMLGPSQKRLQMGQHDPRWIILAFILHKLAAFIAMFTGHRVLYFWPVSDPNYSHHHRIDGRAVSRRANLIHRSSTYLSADNFPKICVTTIRAKLQCGSRIANAGIVTGHKTAKELQTALSWTADGLPTRVFPASYNSTTINSTWGAPERISLWCTSCSPQAN